MCINCQSADNSERKIIWTEIRRCSKRRWTCIWNAADQMGHHPRTSSLLGQTRSVQIMKTCIIFHNMIIEDERGMEGIDWSSLPEEHIVLPCYNWNLSNLMAHITAWIECIRTHAANECLKNDLMDHLGTYPETRRRKLLNYFIIRVLLMLAFVVSGCSTFMSRVW